MFNRAIKLDATYAEAYFGRSHVFVDRAQDQSHLWGSSSETPAGYQSSGSAAPESLGANNEMLETAIRDVTRAIELKPFDAELHNHRGMVYLMMQQYDRAMVDINRALELNYQIASAYYNRAVANNAVANNYYRLNEREQNELFADQAISSAQAALSDLDRARLLGYNEYGWWYVCGVAWMVVKDYEKAIENFSQAIMRNERSVQELKGFPEHSFAKTIVADTYANRGSAYFELGVTASGRTEHDFNTAAEHDFNTAAEHDLNTAVELNPRRYTSFNLLGQIAEGRGEVEKAIAKYEEALNVNKDYFAARYNLVDIFYRYKRIPEAKEEFRMLWQNATYSQLPSFDRSRLETLAENFKASTKNLEQYKQDLELCRKICCHEGEVFALEQLGDLYRTRGDNQLAIKHYEEAMQICNDKRLEDEKQPIQCKRDSVLIDDEKQAQAGQRKRDSAPRDDEGLS
jgi:tetratricopeptide (TPR) repeat protein